MIIQCAARRSGNFLLWRIIHLLKGIPTSYDEFLKSESCFRGPVAFSHKLPEVCPNGIYLVRDGRDVVHSLFQFIITPEYRSRYPDATRTSIEELVELPGFFDRRVTEWRDHVRSYLSDRRPWYLIRYEDLVGARKREIVEALAEYLGVDFSSEVEARVMAQTTVEACRAAAPGHVHKGRSGDAKTYFRPELIERIEQLAGAELTAVGYALSRGGNRRLMAQDFASAHA